MLINGGAGFLGSYLAGHVVEQHPSEKVVIFDKFPVLARIADALHRVTVMEGDVGDFDVIASAMRLHNVDRVAHLAFILGGPTSGKVVPYTGVQWLGTANVLEAAHMVGVLRVDLGGSVAVYGPRPNVPTEDRRT